MIPLLSFLILLTLAAIALRHLLRTFYYPPPAAMPAPVDDDIASSLERLERALVEHAPDVLSALQPGLSDEQLSEIESRHRLRLTDEMKALYRWRNGSSPDARGNLIPGHWFVPLDHAAQTREALRRQVSAATLIQRLVYFIVAGHRTTWLTVLDDGAGDGYFYDPARRRRPGSFFFHFAEIREYRFFPSLTNFLSGAAECYESHIYKPGRRGSSAEDFEKSYALWARYASSPGD